MDTISYIPFQFPGIAKVHCAFQTRLLGKSKETYACGNISFQTEDDPVAVTANRHAWKNALAVRDMAELIQVHGDKIVFEPETVLPEKSPVHEGDGMATTQVGLALNIKTADCQPILICHTKARHIAALHVGWRGNRIAFIQSALDVFCSRYDVLPADLLAVRGPSLGPQCAEFTNFEQEWDTSFAAWFYEKERTMDLWSLTRHQLALAGLPSRSIYGIDLCTATNEHLFYSYRKNHRTGRQFSSIWIAS